MMRTALMDRLNGDADPMPGDIASASAELERLTEQNAELLEALEAIIARWDTPAWKDVEPTAEVMNHARTIIAKAKGTPPSTEGE